MNKRTINDTEYRDLSKFPQINLEQYEVNMDVVTLIPEYLAKKHELIAIDMKKDKLVVATADPLNLFAIDDVKLYTKMDLHIVVSSSRDITNLINRCYNRESTEKALENFNKIFSSAKSLDNELEETTNVTSSPIVRLVKFIISEAIKNRASDIHIEPNVNKIRIRFRIDGDLEEVISLNKNILLPLLTRIKIMGKMDIAESRLPQDGRVESTINGREVDMRISTLPTVHGEKVVIRLLDKYGFNFDIDNLGFSQDDMMILNKMLNSPNGMILVTGQAGSGKTTTLYAILRELNHIEKNIITIEDPVEYKIDGINQVHVNNKAGISFASGLRAILRQDPDIIMVGEIRDEETAKIAIRTAITGHLVFSTLHTNDGASTIIRLMDMGIESYLLSSALIGIISQRLVKVLCNTCKKSYEASYMEKKVLNIPQDKKLILYRPVGCNICNNGYRGRTAIYELMQIDEKLRKMIDLNIGVDRIRKYSEGQGMTTLFSSAIDLVLNGVTSFDEIIRTGVIVV
ncbi:GspE/PulE family protein [Tissierellaceae bacterium HCP3S3_D8]